MAPRHFVKGARLFEASEWSNIQGSKCPVRNLHTWTFLLLNTRPLRRLETMGVYLSDTSCNIPEEPRPELHRCGSLKTRKVNPVTYLIFNVLVVSEFVQNAYTDI